MEGSFKILSHSQFREIFILYYDSLCRFSMTLIKDFDEAEEVVQTVFLNIWENRDNRIIEGNVKSYLFRSVYNQSLNLIKRQSLELKYVEVLKLIPHDYDQNILAEIEAEELKELLNIGLSNLSKSVQEVFILKRVEGLKNKEIAVKLNISVKTVEGRMTKALIVLRSVLNNY